MCNYCGGSGLVNLSAFRAIPAISSGIAFCAYCEAGISKAKESQAAQRQDVQPSSNKMNALNRSAQYNVSKW